MTNVLLFVDHKFTIDHKNSSYVFFNLMVHLAQYSYFISISKKKLRKKKKLTIKMAATDSFIHLCFTNKCPTTIHSHRTKVKIDIEYKEADSSADIPMINQRRSPDLFDSRRSVQQKTYNEVSLMPIRSLLIRICFVSVFPIIIYI